MGHCKSSRGCVSRVVCFIWLYTGGVNCVCVAPATGRLLVIRNNRAEFIWASVWNANPHCHKASFSLKGWRHRGLGAACVCTCLFAYLCVAEADKKVLHYCRLCSSSVVCVNKTGLGGKRWKGQEIWATEGGGGEKLLSWNETFAPHTFIKE